MEDGFFRWDYFVLDRYTADQMPPVVVLPTKYGVLVIEVGPVKQVRIPVSHMVGKEASSRFM